MEYRERKRQIKEKRKKVRGWDRGGESKREDRDNKSSMGAIASSCVCETAGNKEEKTSYGV